MEKLGTIYWVVIGTNDLDQLTLRAVASLEQAHTVVLDRAISSGFLGFAPAQAECIRLPVEAASGPHPDGLVSLLIQKAREGKPVAYLYSQANPEPCQKPIDDLIRQGMSVECILGSVAFEDSIKRAGITVIPARPLAGKRIVVTRARDQHSKLSALLRKKGAEILDLPVIKIQPPQRMDPLHEALSGLNAYDWVVFTSPNGVTAFFHAFLQRFHDLRDFGGARIAAVGPATAARIKEYHLQVDLMPDSYLAKHIANALKEFESVENLKILLARAEVATPELPKLLEDMGAIVDDIPCYRTVAETNHDPETRRQLLENGCDWITFTSGSTVENFNAQFGLSELQKKYPGMKLASIGPETSQALTAIGLQPAAEAKVHTIEGLVQTLEQAAQKRRRSK